MQMARCWPSAALLLVVAGVAVMAAAPAVMGAELLLDNAAETLEGAFEVRPCAPQMAAVSLRTPSGRRPCLVGGGLGTWATKQPLLAISFRLPSGCVQGGDVPGAFGRWTEQYGKSYATEQVGGLRRRLGHNQSVQGWRPQQGAGS